MSASCTCGHGLSPTGADAATLVGAFDVVREARCLEEVDDFLRLVEVLELVVDDDGSLDVFVELVTALGDEFGVGRRSDRAADGQFLFFRVDRFRTGPSRLSAGAPCVP